MNYGIFRILRADEAEQVVADLARASFAQGKRTAKGLAGEVRHHLELERSGAGLSETDQLLIAALQRNVDFQRFAIPRRLMQPLYSRYDPDMEYGAHVDQAVMGGGEPARSDLAVTVFLSPRESYDGGELVIGQAAGRQEFKLDAGEAVVYPACSVRHVPCVTRGTRLVAVTWVQSLVPNEQLRAILHDIDRAVERASSLGDRKLSLLLTKTYHKLLRTAAGP